MAITLNSLINDVRIMVGSPDDTELPNSVIRSVLNERVLSWINRRRPGKKIDSFVTVADQQDYDEKPSDAYRVIDVWWMDADFEFFSPSMKYIPSDQDISLQMTGFNVLDNPALVEAFYKKINAYKNNFQGEGMETDEGLIRLIPYPSNAGDNVYFQYTYPLWSQIIDVADAFIEGVRYEGAAQVLEILAIKRGRVRSGRTFTGGGGANEMAMAKEFRAKANREVPVASAVFARG